MKKITYLRILFLLVVIINSSCVNESGQIQKVSWPEQTNETKPWTRWWWHGSAVNAEDLTANMQQLHDAGFGGVEITPIYDVRGFEDKSLSFQSKEWMEMLEHTLKEGQRLDLGVDLANASGWPFGGFWIGAEHACKNLQFKHYSLKSGESLIEKVQYIQESMVRAIGHRLDISEIKFPISSNENLQELALEQIRFKKPLPLQTLMAYNNQGEAIELKDKVDEAGNLNWKAPEGEWELYALFQGWHGKMVERAGTGGEGNVIDHFSEEAAKVFLKDFDDNSEGFDISWLRAFFNDSYEVDDARGESNWTPMFFEEFKERRRYDLKNHLPALFGEDTEEMNSRVLCDYRETISDLLLDNFTKVWADWAKTHDAIIRNQAHGSPANILDLYEASDIPETEGTDPMRIKMATSAGHTSGKPLIACEAATWLDEHFLSTLSAAKQNFDRYLANGVNHIVYHGTPYSPKEEEWPGWMFYASVHFAPTNTWWKDLKVVNDYVANCQSFMQNSKPDNDILLYFPIYQTWSEKGRSMLPHFGGQIEELTKELSNMLLDNGFTFDYISDRQIEKLKFESSLIQSAGATYKTVLVPQCEYIPLKTLQHLLDLAKSGASIIFEKGIPEMIPGFENFEEQQKELNKLVENLSLNDEGSYKTAQYGDGKILVASDVPKMLNSKNIFEEQLAKEGLWFNRVNRTEGTCYFISNWSDRKVNKWITIQSSGKEAAWFNPMNKQIGKAMTKAKDNGKSEVYVQLNPGETLILQWYPAKIELKTYPLWQNSNGKIVLDKNWEVSFVAGGPTLPESYQTNQLASWTEQSDELKKFSGTASYKTSFELPGNLESNYMIDLGEVHESAIVILNGEEVGTLVGPVFQLSIPSGLLKENNELEIQVTNLMANRIIDLDKRGVDYKKFYNINFAARVRENLSKEGVFTAINWEPMVSGLLGPVSLIEVEPLVVE